MLPKWTETMFHKEFEGLSEKDLEQLKTLLTGFYKKSWEESYQAFTRDIERLILSRDTNKNYRSQLISNLDDLVTTVVLRFTKVNGKLLDAGSEIQHFYGMLDNRVDHVYHEELRRILRPSRSLDDPDFVERPSETRTIDRDLEEEEERELKIRCQRKCLASLPKATLDIFLEYYGCRKLPPQRAQTRLRLALRLANISFAEATPDQVKSSKNKLDSKMSKWRNNFLQQCMEKCLKRERSRSRRSF
ncbi:MAG: hypothetical protein QOH70_675 [Blastocatellia bacterium]|jgi:hypothetical protein|nr:hypothetical protein [Blastocatellia bacterium]